MADTSKFFENFFLFTNVQIDNFTDVTVVQVASAVRPVAYSLLGIYVVLYGISIAYGKIQEPVADSIFKLIRIAVIFALAFNLGYYNIYVADVAQNAPEEMAKLFTPSETANESSTVNSIDKAFNAGWKAGTKYYDAAGLSDLGYYIIAILVWLATLLMCLYAAFLTLLAKIALAVLIAVGPIFIVMTLFEQTKRFFESWVAQILNYMLLQIITAAILGLTVTLFTTNATASAAGDMGMDQILYMVVIALLTTLVIQQAPQIASGLAGGASLGTQGGFAFAMAAASRAGRAGFNQTAAGRALAVRQAARQSTIQRAGRQQSVDREKRSNDANTARRAAFGAAGTSAGRATGAAVDATGRGIYRAGSAAIDGAKLLKSGATSGLERMSRLRARLSRKP